jgi:transcriptional repressor NrdR
MRCPECGVDDDRVVDSRPADHGGAVRRRRSCSACGARFSTIERPLHPPLDVRKRGGAVRPFDVEKVRSGIDRAANGRLDDTVVADLAAAVERSLRAHGSRTVTSEQVGLEVLARLRDVDSVAYVRFASVYKDFEGPEDFEQELVELSKDAPPKAR